MIDFDNLDFDKLGGSEMDDIFSTGGGEIHTFDELDNPLTTPSAFKDTQLNTSETLFPQSSEAEDWKSSSNHQSENLSLEDIEIPEPEKLELPDADNNIAFGSSGYTQSEIDSHISKAEHDMRAAESNMRHHSSIAASKERMGEPHSFEDSQYNNAKRAYNDAKAELRKWENTKPAKD